jgi:NRPS condensation-like uncharacterized protein
MSGRRNLTPADAVWLYSEYERNHQTVSCLMWLDQEIPVETFKALIQERLVDKFPTFSQKAVMSRNPLMMPHWEDDPDFSIDHHVIELHLAEPGTTEQLQELVSEQRSVLLDRDKPLWQFFVIQGYQGNTTAIHARIQHSIADGWSLVRLVLSLADETEGAVKPVVTETKAKESKGTGKGLVGKATAPVKAVADKATAAAGQAATSLTSPLRKVTTPGAVLAMGQDALDETLNVAGDPGRFVEFGTSVPDRLVERLQRAAGGVLQSAGGAADTATESVSQTVDAARLAATGVRDAVEFTFPPRPGQTALHGEVGGTKKAHWIDPTPLDEVKAIGKAVGGTVNDVLLGVLTNGLRKYLVEKDALTVEELFVAMPVSLRKPDDPLPRTLGNKFGLVPVLLPVGIADPVEQVREMTRRIDEIKKSTLPIVSFGLTSISAVTTPDVERMIHKLNQAHSIGVVTNVPGPRHAISLAGANVEGMLGWGGVSGNMAMTFSIFSLNGQVFFGTITDTAIVPDPERVDELVGEAYRELKSAAGI